MFFIKAKRTFTLASLFIVLSLLFSNIIVSAADTVSPRYVPDAMYITIYAKASGSGSSSIIDKNYGHAFIEIENYTGRAVNIGARSVPNNGSITIGRWSVGEHDGIYYNMEAMRRNRDGSIIVKPIL